MWLLQLKHQTLIDLGIGAFAVQKTQESIKHFTKALTLSQRHSAIVHKNLGLALSMAGDDAAAIYHYGQSVKLYATSQPPTKVCVEALQLTFAVLHPFVMPSVDQFSQLRHQMLPRLSALAAGGLHFSKPPNHVQCQISVPHFNHCYFGLNDRHLNSQIASFFYQVCPSLRYNGLPDLPHRSSKRRIKVGFLISRESHTVGRLFQGVIARLSGADVHVTLLTAHAEKTASLKDEVTLP